MKCQKNNGIIMDHFNKSSTPPPKKRSLRDLLYKEEATAKKCLFGR